MGQSDRVDVTFGPKIGTMLPKSTLSSGRPINYIICQQSFVRKHFMTLYIFKFLKR